MLMTGPRKHVLTDLRPYVCSFEECDLKLFADRQIWFNHELECHRLEWCCRFCSHPPFGSENNLSTHMRHRHPQFSSPVQLPALMKASRQSLDRIPATSCPLCHWDVKLRDLNTHTSLDETLVVTLEQFRHHLGTHMEQLALFALPRSGKGEEGDADSNKAAVMTHSDSQSRQSLMETMSWKTVSSRGATLDKSIPDVFTSIAPKIGMHSKDLYPWSHQSLATNVNPLPRYGAAMNQVCSEEGKIYIQGGRAVRGSLVKSDIWVIETDESMACYSITTTYPGPESRWGHAALLVGDAFIVFGGDATRFLLPEPLYLFMTSKSRPT